MGTRCRKCGVLKPHFATGRTDKGIPFEDTGLCMSCRHGKRPGAQVTWQGNVRDVLIALNSRANRKVVKA